MKKRRTAKILAIIGAIMLMIPSTVAAQTYLTPIGEVELSDKIDRMFDSAILLDADTNTVLYSKAPEQEFSPTGGAVHLMSAYVVAHEADFEQEIPIIDAVSELPASARNMDMDPASGERWLVKDLTAAMMLYSAQDAALVLSDHVSNSEEEYVALMNRYAVDLGMEDTEFLDPLGAYDEDQKTTAKDLMVLCCAALDNTRLSDIITAASYTTIKGETIKSRMQIMDEEESAYDERIKGIGEGSTRAAGTNIMVCMETESQRLLFIGFTEEDRISNSERNAIAVCDYFLDAYTQVDLAEVVKSLLTAESITTETGAEVVPGMQSETCVVTVESSVAEDFEAEEFFSLGKLPDVAETPQPGSPIGGATLYYQNQKVAEVQLIASSVDSPTTVDSTSTTSTNNNAADSEVQNSDSGIPIYSAEDWEGLDRPQGLFDKYGFFIVTIAVVVLAALVIMLAHVIRHKRR